MKRQTSRRRMRRNSIGSRIKSASPHLLPVAATMFVHSLASMSGAMLTARSLGMPAGLVASAVVSGLALIFVADKLQMRKADDVALGVLASTVSVGMTAVAASGTGVKLLT